MLKIAGTVILYNPDDNVYENIKTYIGNISFLYIVDNSTNYNDQLVNKLRNNFTNIKYINNNQNIGIASALNIGCNDSIENEYDWILLMDQDSKFQNFVEYLNCFVSIENKKTISVISPNPFIDNKRHEFNSCTVVEKIVTLTSGTLLNLEHFNRLGKFNDSFFIDEVDHEYCLKSKMSNLRVLELVNIPLVHELGDKIKKGKKFKTQHSALRLYYITRNSFYMASKFSKSFPIEYGFGKIFYKVIYKKIFRILRYEDKKFLKFKYMFLGIKDFMLGKYGKF